MSKQKKKAQSKIFQEIRNQLLIQADLLGKRTHYTPYRFEEMRHTALREITTELHIERANLEYEMQISGSDKHMVLRKLEKLHRYISKAERTMESTSSKMLQLLGRPVSIKKELLHVDIPRVRAEV